MEALIYIVNAIHPNGETYIITGIHGNDVTPQLAESAVWAALAIGGSPRVDVYELVENGGVDGNK